jgi:transcriptional regulator with GAF, ATPase, and Fis domain
MWNSLEEQERDILLYLLYLEPPASLDDLSVLGGIPAVRVLHLMERLKRRKVVREKRDYGRGFYFLSDGEVASATEDLIPTQERHRAIRAVFEFYRGSLDEGPEKTLILAELYRKEGKSSAESLKCVHEASEMLLSSGQYEKVATYCEFLFEQLILTKTPIKNILRLLESVTEKTQKIIPVLPLEKQISLLSKADSALTRFEKWSQLVKTKLLLGLAHGNAGDRQRKTNIFDEAWRIAEALGDQLILRSAALSLSDSLFLEGRFAEAIERYEKAVGNLEEFGEDKESLRAAASLGRCYVVCGRISRGMGMIAAARSKAHSLSLSDIVVYCDFMNILSVVEMRRCDEAEPMLRAFLETVSKLEFNSYPPSGAYGCMAFIAESKGDYELSCEYREKMAIQGSEAKGKPPRGSHILEFLYELEKRGYVSESINLDGEIAKALERDDIYMKGIAYRFRALRNLKTLRSMGRAFLDLKNSEGHLRIAGAEVELARTRIVLGDAYLREGGMKAALSYLRQAWSALSRIDERLFPKDLRVVLMPNEDRTELMIERIIGIFESIGMQQDMPTFLERVINAAVMDFSMAMRGAVFVMEDGEPRIAASRNLDPLLLRTDQYDIILKVVSEVAHTGKEMVVPGTSDESRSYEPLLIKTGIDSLVCMPAQIGGRTYGYLYLDSHPGGQAPAGNHLPYIRLLCSQIAVGFSAMALFEKMKGLKDRFEDEASFYKREMGLSNPEKTIVGQSESIRGVIEQIRQVASTDSSVLVTGETGVGKELVAMAIHNGSKRKNGPFIPVNLAALPQELVASELFGHEKGAFTGANERYKGRFELADGGTIFLDEIGDLPPTIQVKLLRVLQEGAFERLGSAEPVHSDFRVIAATNKDLDKEVVNGVFRQDLFYRLNAFPIYVPPLRARKEDIILLAKYFADRFGRKTGKWVGRIPLAELRKLLPYEWPGNVRELKHFVERSVILCEGEDLTFTPPDQGKNKVPSEDTEAIIPLTEMERRYIEKALISTRWKVSGADGAAALLQIKPTTLLSRMKKMGIARRPGQET